MLLYGNHICEKCNTINEWVYIVPQKISEGNFVVDTIPYDKIHLRKRRRISETEYEMCYRCTKCDNLNVFTYTSVSDSKQGVWLSQQIHATIAIRLFL